MLSESRVVSHVSPGVYGHGPTESSRRDPPGRVGPWAVTFLESTQLSVSCCKLKFTVTMIVCHSPGEAGLAGCR